MGNVNSKDLNIRHLDGENIHLFWLPGFMSTCHSTKVDAVFELAERNQFSCSSLDYSGHGESKGDMKKATISQWMAEINYLIEEYAKGTILIVGSSMGGWLALNQVLQRNLDASGKLHQIAGMILIAPAVNMTSRILKLVEGTPHEQDLTEKGFFERPSSYGDEPFIIADSLLKDGEKWRLSEQELDIEIPIHILHGMLDEDVPVTITRQLAQTLYHAPVTISYVQDGDHRLSRPQDIALLLRSIETMVQNIRK